jgi:ubiquitin carboxyl-terminal hydrolase L5
MKHSAEYAKLIDGEKPILDLTNQSQLSEFSLRKSDIEDVALSESTQSKISQAAKSVDDAYDLRQQFIVDTKVAIGEHRAEIISLAEDQQRVKDRKKDYGQALHRWVQKLAEKGILQEVIENS